MKPLDARFRRSRQFAAASVALFVPALLVAQQGRITGPIEGGGMVVLKGNVHPKAQPQFDQGPVDPALKLSLMTLALKPTPEQQAALEQLLTEQQDRSSPNYHHWLTPEQYGDRFGVSSGDIGKVKAWLEGQGFTVGYVARGRNWLTFSGTAAQVTKAFGTEIHRYEVDGELHRANATEPSIPAALTSVVLGVLGLDDFLPKPIIPDRHTDFGAGTSRVPSPRGNLPDGAHVLVPDDIATIYDITRLYKAGFDGSGQRIVVVGHSDINLADIFAFYQAFGAPVYVPQVVLVPGSADPEITAAQDEADLDIEWVGAVARNAQIIYVNSVDPFNAVQYAIDQDLAPVISMSIGWCEEKPPTFLSTMQSLAEQANANGITWLAASGDAGAAACDQDSNVAKNGYEVQVPASIPEVTAVGGTEFNEGGGNYWSGTNSATHASALSYIPETAWNDTAKVGTLAASGGGYSMYYPQPAWQTGPGLPMVNARAVPDLSMAASPYHDPYVIVTGGQRTPIGGTSAATPVFAGIIALLNQYEGSNGQGNINPNLYRLAQTNIFHDITTGTNVVSCVVGTKDCTKGYFGYPAGLGYDPVTGLGSVDAYNLVTEWNAATPVSNIVPSSTPTPVYEQAPDSNGFSWLFTLTLKDTAGVGTALTDFTAGGASLASQIVNLFGTSTIPAGGVISAPLGYKILTVPTTVVSGFTGVDAGGRQWSQQLSVPFNGMQQSSPPAPSISSVVNAASYQAGVSPGELATLFGKNLSSVVGVESPGGATSYRGVSVTVGGSLAPMFTVANVNGQEQINFQVPAGLPSSGFVETVQVNNNGSIGTMNVAITQVQPGIFEYVPSGSSVSYGVIVKPDGSIAGPSNPVARGSTVVMFATGLGPTSPALGTGQPGPVPAANTTYVPVVAINGVGAPVLFSGIAPGFIGLNQVNFTIPANAPAGSAETLSVNVNGVFSPSSTIAVE